MAGIGWPLESRGSPSPELTLTFLIGSDMPVKKYLPRPNFLTYYLGLESLSHGDSFVEAVRPLLVLYLLR